MRARLPLVLVLALLAAAAGTMAWLAVYQVDDAFIVYRYARNLADGSGFVFNPGERVEGVTCFLWTLVLAPLAAVGLDLPKVAPVLTAACGLGAVGLTVRRHAEVEGRAAPAARDLLPGVLLAAAPAFAYWSVGGLETVPFTLLLVLALRAHAIEAAGSGRASRSAVWLGLAALVRPETPVVVAALAADRLLRARAAGRLRAGLRDTLVWASIVAGIFVPVLAFRFAYFGDWLPNTYFAKTGGPLTVRALAGWLYVQDWAASLVPTFGVSGWAVVSIGLVLLVALVAFALSEPRLRAEGLVVSALVAACVLEGGDWMVLHRFFVPALPAVALVAGAALLRLADRGRLGGACAALAAGLVVASDAAVASEERDGGRGLAVQAAGYRHAHGTVADYLVRNAAPGETVALMDVGLIGWLAPDLRFVDITGLTDRAIAHAPGGFLSKRYPVSDLLARDPRYVVLVPGFRIDDRIYQDPQFLERYEFRFSVNHRFNWVPPDAYYLHVFERKGP